MLIGLGSRDRRGTAKEGRTELIASGKSAQASDDVEAIPSEVCSGFACIGIYVLSQSQEGSQIGQYVRIVSRPDGNQRDARRWIEMSADAILPGIIGLAFNWIEISEVEAVLKIPRIEIGIAELGEEACLIGEGRLEDQVGDPPAQIAIVVNAVCARIKLAEAHRKI